MIDPKVGTHYRPVCQCQCVGVGVSAPVFRCVRVSDSVPSACQCHQSASVSVCQCNSVSVSVCVPDHQCVSVSVPQRQCDIKYVCMSKTSSVS